MRVDYIPDVYQVEWPIPPSSNYELSDDLKWSPYGQQISGNIHCYTYDYRFESTWRKPEKSMCKMLECNFVISPDFSVYPYAPAMVNSFQIWRSLAVYSYWVANGVKAIPSITWVNPEQIKRDKIMYQKRDTIAVRGPSSRYIQEWINGAKKVNNLIKPKQVLQFGQKAGSDCWKNARVFNFSLRPDQKKCGEGG